ncbi:MAG: MFS transporter [Pseudomonadota bacterium]
MLQAIVLMFSLFLSIGVLALGNGAAGTLLALRISEAGFSSIAVGFISSGYFAGMIAGPFYAQRLITSIGYIRAFAAFGSTFSAALLIHPFWVDPYAWTLLRTIEGVCMVGMYICAESWINEKSTNEIRGQVFSIYALLVMMMVSLGQLILNVPDTTGLTLFVLVSVLASLAVVPIAITKVDAPPPPQLSKLDLRELWTISPLAIVASLATGAVQGAAYGLGPVYAKYLGLDVDAVTFFMFMLLGGAVVGMWPFGKLSDTIDRRIALLVVLTTVAISSAGLSLIQESGPTLYVLALCFGAAAWPLYSISSAHLNDHADSDQRVRANAGLLVVYGIGAASGPLLAALFNSVLEKAGLFTFTLLVALITAMWTLWRMMQRESISVEDQSAYAPMPRTSPMVVELVPELMDEDAAEADQQ